MNLINFLFAQLTFTIVVLGSLMNLVEKYLPTAIRQTFRYGKYAHNKSDKLVELIELPKSWFSHFYVFAIFWSWGCLLLGFSVYFYDYLPHRYLITYLDFSCGSDRTADTSPFLTLSALSLMTLQCTRRFIESNFLQIFSKKSKINLTHYLCGYLHYYGVFVLIVAKADGFVNGQSRPVIEIKPYEVFLTIITSVLFVYFWYKQYESNMIFINLRKNKTGSVVTETHLLPKGGMFQYVSSPHMTCEIAMYLVLFIVLHQNSSYIYCLAWVVTNQLANALLAHKWYKESFSDYPSERKALIPFIL